MPSLLSALRLSLPISLLCLSSIRPTTAALGAIEIDQLLLSPDHSQFAGSFSSSKSESPRKNPHAPWTHKPYCTSKSNHPKLDHNFCVYTSNTTGANGISLITTPAVAAQIKEQGMLTEDPLSNFLTQEQAEYLYYNAPPYEVVDMDEGSEGGKKGKGVVATRLIKRYETFLIDQAAVVMDLELEKSVGESVNQELLKFAVKRLRVPDAVRSLSGQHRGLEESSGEEEDEGKRLEDIMVTNAFGTSVAGGGEFRGLFPLLSRVNHACNPNAFVLFSQAGISIALKAYRDIQPGEEITVSYLLLGLPHAERVEGLKRWGFTCHCSLCSLPDHQKHESDGRRTAISSTEAEIKGLINGGKIMGAIRLAETVLQNMKDEELQSMLPDQYANLARMAQQAGDQEKAEEYAEEALELLGGMGFLGTEWEGEWDMKKLLGVLGERGVYAH